MYIIEHTSDQGDNKFSMNSITNSDQDEDDGNDDWLTAMINTVAWCKGEITMEGEVKPVHPIWVPGILAEAINLFTCYLILFL